MISILFLGCNYQFKNRHDIPLKEQETSLQKQNLKGQVKTLTTSMYIMKERSNEYLYSIDVYNFNISGYDTCHENYNLNIYNKPYLNKKFISEYDYKNDLKRTMEYLTKDMFVETLFYYDSIGFLIQKTIIDHYRTDTTQLIYERRGLLEVEKEKKGNKALMVKNIYEYDTNGFVLKVKKYDNDILKETRENLYSPDHKVLFWTTTIHDNSQIVSAIYTFNDKDRLIKIVNLGTVRFIDNEVYEYDDYKNITKRSIFYCEESPKHIYYSYKYDEIGNWIEKVHVDSKSEDSEIYKRTITYY